MKNVAHTIETPAWERAIRQDEIRLTVMDFAALAFALLAAATGPLLVWVLLWAAA